jgi:hypothetical protein
MARFMGPEFYVEQTGVLADALQSALAQEFDGVVHIAPAWPIDWNADATVYIEHRDKVHVQIHHGQIITVGLETGSARSLHLQNPWPGQPVEIVDAKTSAIVLPATTASVLTFRTAAGGAYLARLASSANRALRFEPVTGTPATAPKSLGTRTIGIAR